jgi:hypothetical protein
MFTTRIDLYYPLTRRHVEDFVPALPGTYTLSVRLANGTHYPFHDGETSDLQATLLRLTLGTESCLAGHVRECLDRFQCYVQYTVFEGPPASVEITKMILQTNDPIVKIRVISAN